jgi:hypothetical protein
MPASYLDSLPKPGLSIDGWLGWSSNDLETINNGDTYIAALIGINRSGDIQNICKPIPIKDDDEKIIAIIGNGSQFKSNPSFVYIDFTGLGSVYLLKKLSKIPSEIHPPNPLPKTYLSSTAWENATDVGTCLVTILAPIFFGQQTIEGSVSGEDFVDKMATISAKHGKWADLMKEVFSQLEGNEIDIDKITDRLKKPKRGDEPPSQFTTSGFAASKIPKPPYIFIHQLLNSEKWKSDQQVLARYFVSNPSPTRLSTNRPPSPENSDDEDAVMNVSAVANNHVQFAPSDPSNQQCGQQQPQPLQNP